jgi:hypothetical protein
MAGVCTGFRQRSSALAVDDDLILAPPYWQVHAPGFQKGEGDFGRLLGTDKSSRSLM